MITKVTNQNSQEYNKLFREAEELVKNWSSANSSDIILGATINNLYDYFIAFPSIIAAAINKDASNENKTGDSSYYQKYFTILPLDEPVFEVNADTRIITVPQQFKSIGVVGDNTAEIVFFSIDRFFDAIDFGAPEVTAVIEWQRIGNSDETYVDKAYIKELTLKDNKVLIGWVIDDAITEEAGTIEFALRLFIKEKEEVIYSFSTATAKVTINKTLNFYHSEKEVDDKAASQVLSRIQSTHSPDISGDNVLDPPSFSGNIDIIKDEEGNLLVTPYIDENSYYADFNIDKLPIDAIDGKNDTLIAKVTAQSENGADNSKLLYRWFKYDEAGASWQAYKNSNEAVDGNVVEITDTGKYMCVAIENSGIRRVTKESQILYVLEPEQPQVKIADEGKNYISVILLDPANGAELEVKPLNESGFYHTDYDKNNKTIPSFSWRKSNSLIDKEYQDEITDDVGTPIYYATEEGYYYGYALTERNLKTKISENATTYRVTKPLTKPTSANCTIKGITDPIGAAGYIGESIILEFMTYDTDGNIDKVYANDTIYYQWYFDGSYGGKYILVEQEDAFGSTNNGIIKFTPTERGEYRVKLLVVRNNQNYPEKGILEDKNTWYTLEKQLSNGGYDELTIMIRNDN